VNIPFYRQRDQPWLYSSFREFKDHDGVRSSPGTVRIQLSGGNLVLNWLNCKNNRASMQRILSQSWLTQVTAELILARGKL
jgi:hypothetical protein